MPHCPFWDVLTQRNHSLPSLHLSSAMVQPSNHALESSGYLTTLEEVFCFVPGTKVISWRCGFPPLLLYHKSLSSIELQKENKSWELYENNFQNSQVVINLQLYVCCVLFNSHSSFRNACRCIWMSPFTSEREGCIFQSTLDSESPLSIMRIWKKKCGLLNTLSSLKFI